MAESSKNMQILQKSGRPIIVVPGGKLETLLGNDPQASCSIKISNQALADAKAKYMENKNTPPLLPTLLEKMSKDSKQCESGQETSPPKVVINSLQGFSASGQGVTKVLIPIEVLNSFNLDMEGATEAVDQKDIQPDIKQEEQKLYNLLPSDTKDEEMNGIENTIIIKNSVRADVNKTDDYIDVFFKNHGEVKPADFHSEQMNLEDKDGSQPPNVPLPPALEKVVLSPPEKPNSD